MSAQRPTPTSFARRVPMLVVTLGLGALVWSCESEQTGYEVPIVVDTMENAAEEAFAAWPERLYVVDATGTIAYKGGVGPMDFDPDELEAWLARRLD